MYYTVCNNTWIVRPQGHREFGDFVSTKRRLACSSAGEPSSTTTLAGRTFIAESVAMETATLVWTWFSAFISMPSSVGTLSVIVRTKLAKQHNVGFREAVVSGKKKIAAFYKSYRRECGKININLPSWG